MNPVYGNFDSSAESEPVLLAGDARVKVVGTWSGRTVAVHRKCGDGQFRAIAADQLPLTEDADKIVESPVRQEIKLVASATGVGLYWEIEG